MKTEQDEKMASLLSEAFEEKELTVSEELIQRTLKRVAEEERKEEKQVKSKQKPMVWVLRVSELAAAAVLVLTIGTIGVKSLNKEKDAENVLDSMFCQPIPGSDEKVIYSMNEETDTNTPAPRATGSNSPKADESMTYDGEDLVKEAGRTAKDEESKSGVLTYFELSEENRKMLEKLGYSVTYAGKWTNICAIESEEPESGQNPNPVISEALKKNPPIKNRINSGKPKESNNEEEQCLYGLKTEEGTLWLCKDASGYQWLFEIR